VTGPAGAPELRDAAGAESDRDRAAQLLAPIAGKLEATETRIRERIASEIPFVENAGRYLFEAGGKRMRPAMLLLSSRLLGHDSDEEVTYAAVVELIHAATLIHDDIIDHSRLRRGRRTVHTVWGSNLTVLLGDWLYTTAMRMALEHDNLAVIDAFCAATLRMTEGELLVLERLGDPALGEAEYFDVIERKTAALFAAACSVPALIRPADPAAGARLAEYGRALGLCFQLVDDLLDFTAEEERLGKPVLSDLREGKLTLPVLLALPAAGPEERRAVAAVLEDRAFERAAPEQILELIRREGGVERTEEIAFAWGRRAVESLAGFADCDARRALEAAPEFVLRRRS